MSDSPIIPLDKEQESAFVYQIQQHLRAYPRPRDNGAEDYQEYLSEYTEVSSKALLDLGARHIKLKMIDEMTGEVNKFKWFAREVGLGVDEKKGDGEIWASLHLETLWAWMEPYVTLAAIREQEQSQ